LQTNPDPGKWEEDAGYEPHAGHFKAAGILSSGAGRRCKYRESRLASEWSGRFMATHPDDHNQPHHDDKHKETPPAPEPPGGAPGESAPEKSHSPKKTKMARQASKPTMIAREEDEAAPAVPNLSLNPHDSEVPAPTNKPAVSARDEEVAVPAMPNLSLDRHDDEIPVLGEYDELDIPVLEAEPEVGGELEAVSDVAEAQPISEFAEMEMISDIAEAEPASDIAVAEPVSEFTIAAPASDIAVVAPGSDIAVAAPVSDAAFAAPVSDFAVAAPVSDFAVATPICDVNVGQPISGIAEGTGADMPHADATGAEHVLDDDIVEAESASAVQSGAPTGSDFAEIVEEDSGVEAMDAVLGDEPLDRGSRPSARAESPIRAETDDDASVDLATDAEDAPSSGRKHKTANLEATEEVLAGELSNVGFGSGTVNWNDIESGVGKKEIDAEATIGFDAGDDESSAVDLGESPTKNKSASGIDPVAEALESGISLDDHLLPPPVKGPPSVEFDDILGEEIEPTTKKKTIKPPKTKKWADDEDEAAAALFADEEELEAAAVEDEEGVAVPADDDDEAIGVAAKADGEEGIAVSADDDEAEAVAVADDDEMGFDGAETPPPRGKRPKGRVTVPDDDEEPAAKTRPSKTVAPPSPAGPGCLGRMVSAMFFVLVGVLMAAGGIAAVGYVQPELMEQVPETPWIAKKSIAAPKTVQPVSAAQKAFAALAVGDFDAAMAEVKDEADAPAKVALGEARALKVLKESKLPLGEAEKKEIGQAVKELREGKNDTLASQIERAVQEPELRAKLAASEKSLAAANKSLTASDAERKAGDALLKDIGGALAGAKIIDDGDAVKADDVRRVLKTLNDVKNSAAAVDKILKDAEIKDVGPKGVDQLVKAKNDYEVKLTAVNKVLADGKVKEAGAKGVQEVLDARAKVQKDRDDLDTATKAAYAELVKAKVVPEGGDPRKQLAEGTRKIRANAESPLVAPLTQVGTSLSGAGFGVGKVVMKVLDMGAVAGELGFYRLREPLIQRPEQKLDTLADLLMDRKMRDAKMLEAARRETAWVLSKDAKASADARAKAAYVNGLTLRNQEKFADARTAFDQAAKTPGAKGEAVAQAKLALKELTDANAYYLPRIEELQASGNLKAALNEANAGLKAMPDNGKLLAERGLLHLELSRGKIGPDAQKKIRADADAAATNDAAAESAYVLGLLDEELRDFTKAEEHFRRALKLYKGSDDGASRYRVALARVLLMDRPAVGAPPAEKEEKDKSGKLPAATPADRPTATLVHPLTALALSVAIGAQPMDEPEPEAETPEVAKRVRESVELAKSLANSKDARIREQGYTLLAQAASKAGAQLTSATCLELAKDLLGRDDKKVQGVGHMLQGQGLVKQGKRTEGLKEYSRGMEMLHPGLESKEIVRMVEEHPAFQHPDSGNKPNPLLAEKHFGHGLHLYWAKKYSDAEVQFKLALDYYGQDARYLYYLGLAQFGQKTKLKRDQAFHSFDKGAQLEAQSRPSVTEINISLERVQGELRQFLNTFRNKTFTATP
jgi:hypothetical protein